MPEQIGLETTIKDAGFQSGMTAYNNGLAKMTANTNAAASNITGAMAKTESSWRKYGETIDRTGRQSMIGIRAVGEALSAIGVPPGIVDATRGAANMADTFGDLGGIVADINPTFLALGAAASAAAIGIYAVSEASKANAQYIAAAVKPAEDLYEAIKKINEQRAFAKELGTDPDKLIELAKSSDAAGKQVEQLTKQFKELETARARASLVQELRGTIISAGKEAGFTPQGLAKEFQGLNAAFRLGVFGAEDFVNSLSKGEFKLTSYGSVLSDVNRQQEEFNRLNSQSVGAVGGQAGVSRESITALSINKIIGASGDIARAQQASRDKIVSIEEDLADRRVDINRSTAQRIADIQGNLTHSIENMQRDYGKQLANFAKQAVDIQRDAAKQIEQVNRDTAKQIADINRDTGKQLARVDADSADASNKVQQDQAKSLAQVDYNLRKALRNARSARERREARLDAAEQRRLIVAETAERQAEIVKQAAQRKADIVDQRDERIQQINEQRNERLQQINEQRAERQQQLNENKQAAAEEFAYRIAEARRAADEQIAQARRTAAEQVRSAQEAAARQAQAIIASANAQAQAVINILNNMRAPAAQAGTSVGTAFGAAMAAAIASQLGTVKLGTASVSLGSGGASVGASFQEGGWVNRNMVARVHQGEFVLNPQMARLFAPILRVMQPVAQNSNYRTNNISVNAPISGTFNAADSGSMARVAQQIADATVKAVLSAA